jgi:CRP-like cAMP-binding protein
MAEVMSQVRLARTVTYPTGSLIVRAGDPAPNGLVLIRGLACEQRYAPDGARQITALATPGDVLNLESVVLGMPTQDIVASEKCRVAVTPLSTVPEVLQLHDGGLGRILLRRRVAMQREWLVSLGRRRALPRTAHLICELLVRQEQAGLASANGFAFALKQADVADALGLSVVHLCRTVQALRGEGLITWRNRRVTVHDRAGLEALAGFNADYLRLA